MKTYQINGAISGGLFNYIEIPLQYTPVNLSTLNSSLCAVIKISNSGGTLQVYRPNGALNPFTTLDPGNSYVLLASQSFPLNITRGPIAVGQYDPQPGIWYSYDPTPTSLIPTTQERHWGGTISHYNSSDISHLSADVSLYTIKESGPYVGEEWPQIFTLSGSRIWDHPLPLDTIKGVAHGEENICYTLEKGDNSLRYYNNSLKQWFVLNSAAVPYYNRDSLVMSRSGSVIVSIASDIADINEIPSNLTVWIGTNSSGNWSTSNPGTWQSINLPGLHKHSRIEPDDNNTGATINSNFYVMTDTHVFKIGKAGLLDSSYHILETHDFTSTVASVPGSRGITDITSYRQINGVDFVFITIDKGTIIGKYPTSINPNSFVEVQTVPISGIPTQHKTPYEHESIQLNMASYQRYFFKLAGTGTSHFIIELYNNLNYLNVFKMSAGQFSLAPQGNVLVNNTTPMQGDTVSLTAANGDTFAFFIAANDFIVLTKTPSNNTVGGDAYNCISYQELSNTLLVGVSGGKIFKSDNFGATWQVTNSPNANWKAINNRISGDINKVYAVASPGYLYESNDRGVNWTILY